MIIRGDEHTSPASVRIASQRPVYSYHCGSLKRDWVYTHVYTKLKQLVTSLYSVLPSYLNHKLTIDEIKLVTHTFQPNYQTLIYCPNFPDTAV